MTPPESFIADGLQVGKIQRSDASMVAESRAADADDRVRQSDGRQPGTDKSIVANTIDSIGLSLIADLLGDVDDAGIGTGGTGPRRGRLVRIRDGCREIGGIQQIIDSVNLIPLISTPLP